MKKTNSLFDVVFENENFLVINKPTNLSTQKNKFYDESVEEILEKIGEPFCSLERCGIVHRIDRNTTGLLIIAKNFEYQKNLLKIFKNKEIKKLYLSLNVGNTFNKTGNIKFFLRKSFDKNKKIKMKLGNFDDKFAEINFEKISESKDFTLLSVEAITGKTHQIRLAFESINLPIYNDEVYKSKNSKNFCFKSEGHYLHSYYLKFFDGKESFELSAKLPTFFADKIIREQMEIKSKNLISSLM